MSRDVIGQVGFIACMSIDHGAEKWVLGRHGRKLGGMVKRCDIFESILAISKTLLAISKTLLAISLSLLVISPLFISPLYIRNMKRYMVNRTSLAITTLLTAMTDNTNPVSRTVILNLLVTDSCSPRK